MRKVAIIGSGISGISLAKILEQKADITLFEKSRGVSGRLSTRRADSYVFDHGAQYFTIRTDEFRNFLDPLFKFGAVQEWKPRYMRFNKVLDIKSELLEDEEIRYVGSPNMNSICKYLSEGLNIRLNTKIISMKKGQKWTVFDEHGNEYNDFDWVISTAPSPQTMQIFPKEFKYYESAKSINMTGAFALMLGFNQHLKHRFDAAHILNSDISWIAFNNTKPSRPLDNASIVIHSSEQYFNANINNELDNIILNLSREAEYIIGNDLTSAEYKSLHPWRYATVATSPKLPPLIDTDLFIASCGDWCVGGRVEGAFTSAYNTANKIKELL